MWDVRIIIRSHIIKSILHLSTDFQNQKLYSSLVEGFARSGFRQSVYIQHRGPKKMIASQYNYPEAKVVVSHEYRWWMKILFAARVRKVFIDLRSSGLLNGDTLVVAYFLMTDGAVAYRINQDYGLPYVVCIRHTDINLYLKYRPWLKNIARNVLINAKFIILASPAYKQALKWKFGEEFYNEHIVPKLRIIGNIINELWFIEPPLKVLSTNAVKLIYMGEFLKAKRIQHLIRAFDILRRDINIELTLVGNYGSYSSQILKLAAGSNGVKILDRVSDVQKLISIVDFHDIFVMPSKTETFGMAYIEAMARGLPVIYTKYQGIDGYFPENMIGCSVSEPVEESIVAGVLRIINNYESMSNNAKEASKIFKSSMIIDQYSALYKTISDSGPNNGANNS